MKAALSYIFYTFSVTLLFLKKLCQKDDELKTVERKSKPSLCAQHRVPAADGFLHLTLSSLNLTSLSISLPKTFQVCLKSFNLFIKVGLQNQMGYSD